MGGLLAITESILADARKAADAIMAKARDEEKAILAKFEEDKAALRDELSAKLHTDCMSISRMIEGAAEAEARQIVLSAKKEAIDKVVDYNKEAIKNAPDAEYFEFLEKLCKKNREDADGVMYLSDKDLKRLPKDFSERINAGLSKGKITISEEAYPIDGGFIIKYGKIDLNCTIDSIFEEKKNSLADIINESLSKE